MVSLPFGSAFSARSLALTWGRDFVRGEGKVHLDDEPFPSRFLRTPRPGVSFQPVASRPLGEVVEPARPPGESPTARRRCAFQISHSCPEARVHPEVRILQSWFQPIVDSDWVEDEQALSRTIVLSASDVLGQRPAMCRDDLLIMSSASSRGRVAKLLDGRALEAVPGEGPPPAADEDTLLASIISLGKDLVRQPSTRPGPGQENSRRRRTR